MKLTILDSTLRDGLQGEGVSFSESDKMKSHPGIRQAGNCVY